jgi:hypothetical protein
VALDVVVGSVDVFSNTPCGSGYFSDYHWH